MPIAAYDHLSGDCAVVGGYVSRRAGVPLYGRYVFGDFCSGRIWSIPASFAGGELPEPLDTDIAISSFGEGFDGTLYVVHIGGRGRIYRITGS